ncbi:MAG: heme-dependent oxidative N-demethylase subunit alpha family protein [Roseimicrobium sp.]
MWLPRDGKFRFELGLRQGDDKFFQSSQDHKAILAARARVLAENPTRHLALLDEGVELLHETRNFAHKATGTLCNEQATPLAQCLELGKQWEPDFLLLKPAADGDYHLLGGCVCFPSSWDLHEKMGRSVTTIHAQVPTLNENLARPIHTFLQRIKPGTVWERWNWGMAADDAWNHHPTLARPRLHAGSTLADSWLRIEHQAFRALDVCGGLLFAIRVVVTPLTEIAQDASAAVRLAELLETMPDEIADYKGLRSCRNAIAQQLREAARHASVF